MIYIHTICFSCSSANCTLCVCVWNCCAVSLLNFVSKQGCIKMTDLPHRLTKKSYPSCLGYNVAHLCTFHPDPRLWDSNLTVYTKTHRHFILLDSLKISSLTFASSTEIRAQLVRSDYNWTSCSIINWLINLYHSVPVSEHVQTIRT